MTDTEKERYNTLEDFGFGPNVMKKTKVCPKCGQMTDAASSVCPACGEKLPDETLFNLYKKQHACCPDCDTVLSPGSRYCPNCGKHILPQTAGNEEGDG